MPGWTLEGFATNGGDDTPAPPGMMDGDSLFGGSHEE